MSKIFLSTLVAFTLFSSCGKYFDRFSRLEGSTNVTVKASPSPGAAILNGGLMVYFIPQAPDGQNLNSGQGIGFTQEELSASKSIALPNGTYKIYGLGFTGANPLGGSARCALGNNGGNITFSGGDQTISLHFSAATCGFNSATVFSSLEGASGNSSNFDELRFNFCDSVVSSGVCSPNATNTTNGIRFSLLAGKKENSAFVIDESSTISSVCFTPAAGTVSGTPTIPIGTNIFSPPLRVTIHSEANCSTVAATYVFAGGLEEIMNPADGATAYSTIPASQFFSFVKIKFP